ncbi:hypothetical protein FOVG_08662 [Fusarium oxysporum f. sp. pisi HDV247]|uniref:Uncharacterized protein n=1 Tax=Fusarium oxysporum f. sp. pisi HDV247 TaxID=1080344 RepID=W9PVS7_FUSOX|nr:hypothetical protein FOVG_08662 [Fusarium oxysporum f. sp. pisi HDV247]
MILLQSTQAPFGQPPVHKVIQSAMNRLVGIRTQEDDPPSCPGYVLPMASFERAVMNAEKAKDEIQRRQWTDMSLRSLRNFMDAQRMKQSLTKWWSFKSITKLWRLLARSEQEGRRWNREQRIAFTKRTEIGEMIFLTWRRKGEIFCCIDGTE